MKRLFWIWFALATSANAADRWWEIRIGGQPAGYQHTAVEELTEGKIRTTDEQIIVINRLGSRVEVKAIVASMENAAGQLLSTHEESSSSEQTTITDSELHESEIELHSKVGSNTYTRKMPLRAPVCGPQALTRLLHEQLKNTGDKATCRLFQAVTGPFTVTYTLLGWEERDGQRLLRVTMTLSDGTPGINVLLDEQREIFQLERDTPFGKMVIHVADRETALLGANGASLPAESYNQTLARSNIRFADARAIERIKLKLTHRKPEVGWPVLRGPSQTIIEKTPTSIVLEITRPERKAVPNGVDEQRYLKPNQVLQSDDAEVLKLARTIVGDETDRFKAARKLQDWVAQNLTYDLGIALAPASEVVRNRRGTCVAYAVLLASMARAVGIPSRVPMGFIYTGGIWGGHAWTEVLIDGQWVPLDAAGYRPGIADAARFQFDSYTLEDNLAAGSLAGLQLYGNVDIAVMEYSVGGKTFQVPEAASAFSIAGDEYRNPWIGFSMRKPEGSSFSKLEAVWPDRTLLEIKSEAATATIGLLEGVTAIQKTLDEAARDITPQSVKLAGRDAVIVSNAKTAQLVLRDGESLWVITTEGDQARALLDQIAGAWKWISAN
jgi:transglutaminase-like putative cysteine protease